MKNKVLLAVLFLSVICMSSNAQLTVNTAPADSMLIKNVLLGSGVVASNFSWNGVSTARAEFNCNNCNLGFSHGILLTSGAASAAIGSSGTQTGAGAANGTPADPQLTALANNGFSSFDPYSVEFDFSVAADSVEFRYVFASEEYNDYVPPSGNFNDIFAFFISGPGIVGQKNIALLPGTTTPVAIWNVNNGFAPHGTPSSGPCNNCAYFRDNTNQSINVQYDGATVVLVARSAVQPCKTYHIKLAISDIGDPVFDSGVFLEANSFSSFGTVTITANVNGSSIVADTIYTCPGQSVTFTAPVGPSYNWSTGDTTQVVTVSPLVPTSYIMYEHLGSCFAFSNTFWVIPVPPTATITPSGPTNLCPGDSVILTANAGNTWQWSSGATSQSITVSTAGTFTVTVSNGPGCSATSMPVSVSVGSATANIAGNLDYCAGSSTTLTANLGAVYQWSNGDVTQTSNITAPGNYTVTVTQAAGCTATATVAVIENPLPVPVIAGTFSACQGQAATLNAGGPYSAYQWSLGSTSQVLNPMASGTYTVTVTDGNGCTGSTSQAVVINPLPTPVIAGTFAFCAGGNVNLNAGGPYAGYLWTGGSTGQVLNVTAGATYAVTVTDNNGCTGSTSQLVTMNPNPVPVIAGNSAFCQGQNTTLDAGGPYSAYQWNGGSSAQTINVSTAGNYTVTVTDANGCIGTATKNIIVNPLPAPVIAGTFAVCQGQNATLNAGGPYTAYLWSGGATAQVINPNTAGTYTVTVTDNNGCSASASQNVVVNANPVPVIAGTFAFCSGNNVNLNAGGPYAGYLWTGGASSQVLNVTAGGTYTVTVTNNNGCTGTASQAVVMNPLPVPVIGGITSICQGQNTMLDAGGPYTAYQWNGGSSAQTINVSASGSYTVTVTDANGCTGSATKNVVVNSLPVPVIAGTFTVCQGQNATLNAGGPYVAYAWSSGSALQVINPNTSGIYTVTVTDNNGCSATTSQNVTVNPVPAPVIAGTFAFCAGNNVNLNAGGPYAAYLWTGGSTGQVLNVTAGGNYAVTVTNNFGCSATTSQAVVMNPLPVPVIAGNDICQGQNTTLSAGGPYTAYIWNGGATSQTINVNTAGTYTVTVTDANGCTGSDTKNLVVNPLPVPVIAGTFTVCQGQNASLNAGGPYNAYAWSGGSTSQVINPNTAGIYTVTVTDNNGCSASTSQNVTVNPVPAPVIAGTFSFCAGNNVNLNAGGPYTAYLWTGGATSQVLNVTAGGNYAVTVTNGFGCSGSTSQLVTMNPLPTPAIAGNDFCAGTNSTLNAGAGYAMYQWSNNASTQTITVNTAGTYTVTVTDNNGCVNNDNISIVQNPLPVPVIAGTFTVCQGQNASLNAGGTYSAYAWSGGSSSQTITPNTAGVYTVTVTDNNGCSASTSQNVTVNPVPAPVIAGTFAFCAGDNVNLNAGGPYAAYLWTGGSTSQVLNVTSGGNYAVTVTNGFGCSASTSQLVTMNPLPAPVITGNPNICIGNAATLNAGNGYVSYAWSNSATSQTITTSSAGSYTVTVTDVNGCIGSTSQVVVVNSLPSPAISGNNAVCSGTATIFDAGPGYAAYLWSTGAITKSINVGTAGTYTVTVTDLNACSNFTSKDLSVNALPQPAITGVNAVCDGLTSTLTATTGFNSYLWSTTATSQSIVVNLTGNYTVTVTDGNGCSNASPSFTFTANPVPAVTFSNDSSLSCEAPVISFINTSTFQAGAIFNWNFGDNSASSALQSPTHLYGLPGLYPVSLTITNPSGCSSSYSANTSVTFVPLPEAKFSADPKMTSLLRSSVNFDDQSANAVSWLWDFGDGMKSTLQEPQHQFDEIGDYQVSLTVTNIAGCVSIFREVVSINPFYVPSAFTPNGDGRNDYFYNPGFSPDVSSYLITVWNRWGQKVFEAPDALHFWNGKDRDGKDAPQSTYVYTINVKTLNGKDLLYKGTVTLLR